MDLFFFFFFFSSRRRHTRFDCDWSSDVCSSDLKIGAVKSLEFAAQPNASDKLFSIILRVRRNEVFKALGLDLSLVGFREILALVDELEMVLMRRSTGLTNPGSP